MNTPDDYFFFLSHKLMGEVINHMEGGARSVNKKLPIGIEFFSDIRRQGFYYVDKTMFIKELLENRGKVNLFTRPRRFGKTLSMSTLKEFFEIGADPGLFSGLKICEEKRLCEEYQGKYPVLFLTLKGVEGENYEEAGNILAAVIANECVRLSYLADSKKVNPADAAVFNRLMNQTANRTELRMSLATLMRMLHAYYGEQVILLIDEYDVPLDKANDHGYYDRMITFLRGFFGDALKTNPDLFFAVVTGCLRISKESIFTGINNMKADTISDRRYDEYFGFTDEEVKTILEDYNLTDAYDDVKKWYDGYRFGDADVYCPWDVISHCDKLLEKPDAVPRPYWDNTSSNQLVRHFIDLADTTTKHDIERLIAGETIEKKITENLTYDEIDKKADNLWSVLYLTGYLTLDRKENAETCEYRRLVIPNREIKELFIEKIQSWFEDRVLKNQNSLEALYRALYEGNAEETEKILNQQLRSMISYYDAGESFYYGFLLGLLRWKRDWVISSNREAGDGRSDIQICSEDGKRGMILELKYARTSKELTSLCDKAVRQAEERKYADPLVDDGYEKIFICGIAFHKKRCAVKILKLHGRV